jgi:GNAT superfamily N-acetyltransferase
MSFRIRNLCQDDFDQWKPLWEGYVTFYQRAVDPSQVTELWGRFFQSKPELFCFVAVDKSDQLIGLVHFLYHVNTSTLRPKCYLQDLFVDPKARVGGAGRALIEEVYAAATSADAVEVYWNTQEFNSVARVLYDRVGERTPFIKYRKLL